MIKMIIYKYIFFIYRQQFLYADWLYIDKKPILVDGSLGLCMTL